MNKLYLYTLFSVAAALNLALCCKARTWNGTFIPYPGVRYTGRISANYSVKSEVQCGLKCGIHHECTAFNLGAMRLSSSGDGDGGKSSRSCELLNIENGSVTDLTEEVGWTFMSSKIIQTFETNKQVSITICSDV